MKKVCMVDGCDKEQSIRGLCRTHYCYLSSLVHRKQTTYDEQEKLGHILPKRSAIENRSRTMKYFLGNKQNETST